MNLESQTPTILIENKDFLALLNLIASPTSENHEKARIQAEKELIQGIINAFDSLSILKRLTVLDIGSGTGATSVAMKEMGHNICSLDPQNNSTLDAYKIPHFVGTIQEYIQSDRLPAFDLLLANRIWPDMHKFPDIFRPVRSDSKSLSMFNAIEELRLRTNATSVITTLGKEYGLYKDLLENLEYRMYNLKYSKEGYTYPRNLFIKNQ